MKICFNYHVRYNFTFGNNNALYAKKNFFNLKKKVLILFLLPCFPDLLLNLVRVGSKAKANIRLVSSILLTLGKSYCYEKSTVKVKQPNDCLKKNPSFSKPSECSRISEKYFSKPYKSLDLITHWLNITFAQRIEHAALREVREAPVLKELAVLKKSSLP